MRGRPTGTPSLWVAYYQIGFPHGPKKWQYSRWGLCLARVAYAYGPESVRIRTTRRLYPKHIPLVRGCSRKPRLGRARRRRTADGGRRLRFGWTPPHRCLSFHTRWPPPQPSAPSRSGPVAPPGPGSPPSPKELGRRTHPNCSSPPTTESNSRRRNMPMSFCASDRLRPRLSCRMPWFGIAHHWLCPWVVEHQVSKSPVEDMAHAADKRHECVYCPAQMRNCAIPVATIGRGAVGEEKSIRPGRTPCAAT